MSLQNIITKLYEIVNELEVYLTDETVDLAETIKDPDEVMGNTEEAEKAEEPKIQLKLHASDSYVRIDLGAGYLDKLMKAMKSIYPTSQYGQLFQINKEDPSMLGCACKITPDQEVGEVFLIIKKDPLAPQDMQKAEYYFYNKLFEETTAYLEKLENLSTMDSAEKITDLEPIAETPAESA